MRLKEVDIFNGKKEYNPMEYTRIAIQTAELKHDWTTFEIQKTKEFIDTYFSETADWDHSVRDMGLEYTNLHNDYAALIVKNGDFFMEEGIIIKSIVRTRSENLVLIAQDYDNNEEIYYHLTL